MDIQTFAGIRISISPYASTLTYRVEAWGSKRKRRKNWCVRKHYEPCMYRLMDGSIVVHPTIYKKLLEASNGHR